MKTTLFICTAFIFGVTGLYAADNYEVGDTLYVWAKSGLNMREGPGTNSEVLTSLSFGTQVIIIEKSDISYNIKACDPTPPDYELGKSDPLILYGHWVVVRDSSGQVGYVIDQYLLPILPVEKTKYYPNDIPVEMVFFDTTAINLTGTDDEFIIATISKYAYRIESSTTIESKGGWATFIFPEFTIEEVIVILSTSWSESPVYITRNWTESVSLIIELCDIEVKMNGAIVNVVMFWSC